MTNPTVFDFSTETALVVRTLAETVEPDTQLADLLATAALACEVAAREGLTVPGLVRTVARLGLDVAHSAQGAADPLLAELGRALNETLTNLRGTEEEFAVAFNRLEDLHLGLRLARVPAWGVSR